MLSGSMSVKAAHKTLVKLTPDYQFKLECLLHMGKMNKE